MKKPCNKLNKKNRNWYDFFASPIAKTPKTKDKVSSVKHVTTIITSVDTIDVVSALFRLGVFRNKTQIMKTRDTPIIKPAGNSKPKYNGFFWTMHLKTKKEKSLIVYKE